MRARGFTVIELLVATAIGLIAVAAGVVMLAASQRSFQSGVDDRAVQETGRVALDELSSRLRTAGYGLEPTFAFDVGPIFNTVMDRIPTGTTARFGGYACGGAGCRDSAAAPDELVFYARDPLFTRTVTNVSTTTLTLGTAPATGSNALQPGQVLQVMCYGAANQWLWTYVTVNSVTLGANAQAAATVGLRPNAGLPLDFPTQNTLLAQACFTTAGANVRAFKIDRFRYYIGTIDDGGTEHPWLTAGSRPYLMLDQGLGQAGGATTRTVIAPDVEDLQVAYVFPMAAVGAQVLGAELNTPVLADTAGDDTGFNLNPLLGIPSFSNPSLDPIRTTHHPANIRAVRVSITVRSPRLDPNDMLPMDAMVPAAFNRIDAAAEPGFKRTNFETTVYTRNLETRLPVFPIYDPNWATTCCTGTSCAGNCGGG